VKYFVLAVTLFLASASANAATCFIPYCGTNGGCTTGPTWAQCNQWPAEGHEYHGLAGGFDMTDAEGEAYMVSYCASWGGVLYQNANCSNQGIQNADIHDCGWAN
jgi:hypothetical protein